MAGLGKQAKILTDKQVALALAAVATWRYPLRDRVSILLSVRTGLRAKEISNLRWSMVTDARAPSPTPSISSMGHPRASEVAAKSLWPRICDKPSSNFRRSDRALLKIG